MSGVDFGRIAGRLALRGDAIARKRVALTLARLAARATPKGIRIEALEDRLRISGRSLKRRMIDDPAMRNFGR
jgi:hypothetical protein